MASLICFCSFCQALDVPYDAYIRDNPEQNRHHPLLQKYYKTHNRQSVPLSVEKLSTINAWESLDYIK